MLKEYLSELLSMQCEQAYGTALRLRNTGVLSDEDMAFLVKAQDVLISVRDRFRVTGADRKAKTEHKEANDGKER